MISRQSDQCTFAPEWQNVAVSERSFPRYDRYIHRAAPKRGNETRSRTLDHSEFDLRKPPPVLQQCRTKISSRKRCIETNRHSSHFAASANQRGCNECLHLLKN